MASLNLPRGEMRVLACGGRDYRQKETVRKVLGLIASNISVLVHGGATGADTLAGEVANEMGIDVEVYPAQWDLHGRSAGPIRNQRMLESGIDLVVAFPGGRGTADMMRRAEKSGVLVLRVGAE